MKAGRRVVSVLVAASLMGTILLVAASSAPARQGCTLKGTSGDDPLIDTGGASVICSKAGNDLVEAGARGRSGPRRQGRRPAGGQRRRDVIVGGAGTDTIVTTDGTRGTIEPWEAAVRTPA
jgi:hypothetical protein